MKYFYINNIKFNYKLEFQSNSIKDYWKVNAPLIEYCESVGVNIPHYCYNKSLSISGNCRMCLVELENAPKPVVSCAMSAQSCLNNSKVFTNSPLVRKARENILEFLLLNHPLDCPICDQGGECDLQDQSLFFGMDKKRFYNFKRTVTDKNIGAIVKTVMTRCIHCTRCVRFAGEIAGVEDLGMFGRGLKSEIGNYVNKTFQSEISGNIIDLCPVGALTSKPYPFLSRSWELKMLESVDYSDSLTSSIQIYVKNNKVVKILPGFDKNSNNENWISDKTRFSFDGMFSPERLIGGLIIDGNNKYFKSTWKVLLEELVYSLYFQDHLNKHLLRLTDLLIIFNGNSNLEVLNLLLLLSKKYSFIKLRKSEGCLESVDTEQNFLMNKESISEYKLNQSTTCLLLGVNTRYEASSLHLSLRKRYLKGNFNLFSLSSHIDLTVPVQQLGINLNYLKSIAEGNSLFCQELVKEKSNPIIITNKQLYKKYGQVLNLTNFLQLQLNKYHLNWSGFNIVGSTINEAGVNYLNKFQTVSPSDIKNSCGLYFINSYDNNSLSFQKLINLKLLNYSFSQNIPFKFAIEQNGGNKNNAGSIIKNYNIFNYLNLPNKVFFESNGMTINSEGIYKKSYGVIPSSVNETKNDKDILRKLFLYLGNINYLSYNKDNFKIYFNSKSLLKHKLFIEFLYYSSNSLKSKTSLNYITNKPLNIVGIKYKKRKKKLILTNTKIWLNDFYISGKDYYSSNSETMVNCSKLLRLEKTNFISL